MFNVQLFIIIQAHLFYLIMAYCFSALPCLQSNASYVFNGSIFNDLRSDSNVFQLCKIWSSGRSYFKSHTNFLTVTALYGHFRPWTL